MSPNIIRTIGPCFLLCALLGGTGGFSSAANFNPTGYFGDHCPNPFYKPYHELLKPLADLLAKGEGDYDSVNRGRAGDTMQGLKGLTGKAAKDTTVEEILELQRGLIYAVGRYQFIPKTLRWAVKLSSVKLSDKFDATTQDKLLATLILYKRPAIGAYLRGDHNDLGWALDELAREWASVEYRHGRGYYDHVNGNRAHITRAQASIVLKLVKGSWQG